MIRTKTFVHAHGAFCTLYGVWGCPEGGMGAWRLGVGGGGGGS